MKKKYFFKLFKRENDCYGLVKITEEDLKTVIQNDHPKLKPEKVLAEGYVKEDLYGYGYSSPEDYYGETKYFIRELDESDALAITVNRDAESIRTGNVLNESSGFYVISWDLGECIFAGCAKIKDGSQLYGNPFKNRFSNHYHPFAGIWILNHCIIADEDCQDLSFDALTLYRAVPKKQE